MTQEQFPLRTKDVAHILDMCPDDVTKLARSKKLKATKKGRFWRFSPEDVERYKREKEKQS